MDELQPLLAWVADRWGDLTAWANKPATNGMVLLALVFVFGLAFACVDRIVDRIAAFRIKDN